MLSGAEADNGAGLCHWVEVAAGARATVPGFCKCWAHAESRGSTSAESVARKQAHGRGCTAWHCIATCRAQQAVALRPESSRNE